MIKLKLGGKFYDTLAVEFGYQDCKSTTKRLHAIEKTNSTYEWLKNSSYDLNYSNEEFLAKLCSLLAISPIYCNNAIKKAKKRLHDMQKMKQPYLLARTNFKQESKSPITLGVLSQKMKVLFDKEKYLYTAEEEFLKLVSLSLNEHFQKHDGKIEIFGDIKSYSFFDRHGIEHVFDTHGSKIEEKFSDIFSYFNKIAFENSLRHEWLSYKEDKQLFWILFKDIRKKLTQTDAQYLGRISDENLALFDTENIENYFASIYKNKASKSKIFYSDYYDIFLYVEYQDKELFIRILPIDKRHSIDEFIDKDKLYKKVLELLQLLVSENNLFDSRECIKIPYQWNMTNVFKKVYADYLLDNNIKISTAIEILQQLHDEVFISTDELIEYLHRASEIYFKNNNMRLQSRINHKIKKLSRVEKIFEAI